jgi:hypothetical protein
MLETSTLISNNGTQFTQASCLLRHVWPQCQGHFPRIVLTSNLNWCLLPRFIWWKLGCTCRIQFSNGRLSLISWHLSNLRAGFLRHDTELEDAQLET